MRRAVGIALNLLALMVALAALAVGGIAYWKATQIQLGLLEAVVQARSALSGLEDRTVEIPIRIQKTFPVQAAIPVREEFVVPIRTVLPVSTEVEVPVQFPLLGERRIAIPIEASVPISVEVIIPISRTLAVETSLSVDLEVPVRVDTARLGVEGLLRDLDARLADIEGRLRER
ncbi:MAG: hypothetical protein RMK65_04745 [Anaerolineae bacterium]|nr:hypothetical protein [Anaerolineae bacterium]MCX8068677.1 hypothetical protein [Anaerolineae bacterium]MDW7991445.1 hypothetical protein [Anaerolineae bacterium]